MATEPVVTLATYPRAATLRKVGPGSAYTVNGPEKLLRVVATENGQEPESVWHAEAENVAFGIVRPVLRSTTVIFTAVPVGR
jgi:hypothetical protein